VTSAWPTVQPKKSPPLLARAPLPTARTCNPWGFCPGATGGIACRMPAFLIPAKPRHHAIETRALEPAKPIGGHGRVRGCGCQMNGRRSAAQHPFQLTAARGKGFARVIAAALRQQVEENDRCRVHLGQHLHARAAGCSRNWSNSKSRPWLCTITISPSSTARRGARNPSHFGSKIHSDPEGSRSTRFGKHRRNGRLDRQIHASWHIGRQTRSRPAKIFLSHSD